MGTEQTKPVRWGTKSEAEIKSERNERLGMLQTAFEGFPGFEAPRFTQVPDVLFDFIMPALTEPELKTLLYIIRRTYGFKKEDDPISQHQLVNGITKHDGTILDYGTGLSLASVKRAVKNLCDAGLVIATRNVDPARGNLPTTYKLRMVDNNHPPRLTGEPRVSSPENQGLAHRRATQDTVLQDTTKQDIDHSNIRMAHPEKGRDQALEGKSPTRGRATSKSFATPGDVLALRADSPYSPGGAAPEGGEEKPVGKGIGRPPGRPAGRARPETQTEEWQAISRYVSDFMRELGDQAPLKSSTTRAYNLFTASGVPLATFLNKMYEARSRTQESSGNIDQIGDDPTYKVKRKTKAAYFFAVLEDVLNLIDDAERARREAGTGSKRGRPKKDAGVTPGDSTSTRERDSDGPFAAYIET